MLLLRKEAVWKKVTKVEIDVQERDRVLRAACAPLFVHVGQWSSFSCVKTGTWIEKWREWSEVKARNHPSASLLGVVWQNTKYTCSFFQAKSYFIVP
jgi:hypothetical protein